MTPTTDLDVDVRPLREGDLSAADHVVRLAFGTFLGLAEPATFMGDAAFVHTRWRTDPSAAFAAEYGGQLAGSNFATQWGSVGFFGPLSVRPELWDRGVGRRLMEPVMDCFAGWQTTHAGLFTFAQSQKHVGLYQRFGFWPRFLTAVMSKAVGTTSTTARYSRFSDLTDEDRPAALAVCRGLTDAIFDGLDVTREICAVADYDLGDTVLVWNDSTLVGVAICHCGPGTEAGSGTCYVKFGAVRPGPRAERSFQHLLHAVEHFAEARALPRLTAGVNTSRHEAYRAMSAFGFRTDMQGIAMHRPNTDGYSRAGVFVIDDWR
ncbi:MULTISPECIES: GNAT family N-acetyltransferase [unclassified Mycobacterium]|uniref:GNAT family N-acetyltransferase n=1 Tax=unclassified Mycobacterium TaxID=2642494 RepID=UPI0029C92313|nr:MULTISPECIES: GNAT family N-acetyltransferase [unclassified Mycobacterium]